MALGLLVANLARIGAVLEEITSGVFGEAPTTLGLISTMSH